MQELPFAADVQDGEPTVVTLSGELDLGTVSTLRQALTNIDGANQTRPRSRPTDHAADPA